MRVSHSSMAQFRTCPMSYYLNRVKGIRAVKSGRAISFGQAMHEALEVYWSGGTFMEVALKFNEACGSHKLNEEDRIYGSCLLMGYKTRWGDEDASDIPNATAEEEFTVPIMGMDGEPTDLTLHGFMDVNHPGFVMDHKTSSANLTPTYIKELARNPQSEEYLLAAIDQGSEVNTACWDIIKSNRYTRRLATPEADRHFYKTNTKYGNKGDPKPGTYLEDETWEEFEQRIIDDIAVDPDRFFVRVELPKTEEELDRRRYDVYATARLMQLAREHEVFPRNEGGCSKFGGCQYQPICWDGVDPVGSELYTIDTERGKQ